MGDGTIPFPNSPDKIQALLQNQGSPSPSQQAPTQQPPPQQPTQAQPPDALETLKQNLVQQYQANTPKPPSGGPIRSLLQNFFSGMGQSMMHEAGLPTPYDKQQAAMRGIEGVTVAQQNLELHKAMAGQFTPVPLVGMDGKPITDPTTGKVIQLPANHAQTFYAGQAAAASRVQAAQIQAGPTVNTPQNLQETLGLPPTTTVRTLSQAAGIPGKEAATIPVTDDIRAMLHLPAGVTSIPSTSFIRAMGFMMPQTKTGFEWKETSPGTWEPLPTKSVTTRGIGVSSPTQGAGPRSSLPAPVHGGGTIYAFDPKTNETVMTTPQEAATNGYSNPRKVTQANIENDRQLNNRLYDVAAKVQRYEQSINTPISDVDRAKIADLLGTDKLQFGAFGAHLPTDWLTKLTQAMSVGGLSKAAQDRLINYYNVREAMTGYTRVLTGSGRSNETNLQLNLQAMPDPIMPDNFTKNGINQFKQNIHIAGQGLPRMPGIQRAQDVLNPSGGAGNAPAIRFTEGSDTYNIPADKVEAFKAKHPQAVPSGR